MNKKRASIIEKTIVYTSSLLLTTEQCLTIQSFVFEQNFDGYIVDTVNLPYIDQTFSETKGFVSINHPNSGLCKDFVLDCIVKTTNLQNCKTRGFLLSLDKLDIETSNIEACRNFLKEIEALSKSEIMVSIKNSWVASSEQLSRIISLVAPYPKISLVIVDNSVNKKQMTNKEICKIASISGFDKLVYQAESNINNSICSKLLDIGFKNLIVPPSVCLSIVNDKV